MNNRRIIIILFFIVVMLILVIYFYFFKTNMGIGNNLDNDKCMVVFNSNGGSRVAMQTVNCGEYIVEPVIPKKDGYRFIEWDYGNNKYNFSNKVLTNLTLNAVWEKIHDFNVKLVVDDNIQEVKIDVGSVISKDYYKTFEKDGYDIEWFINNKKIDIGKYKVNKDLTIIGKYIEQKKYSVSFVDIDGSYIDKKDVYDGKMVDKPKDPVKSNYLFVGWELDGKLFDFNTIINKDIVLRAKWKKVSNYHVYFDSNGGSSVTMQDVLKGNKVIRPNDPVKSNYFFVGWELDGKLFDFNTIISNDVVLKALWKENKTKDRVHFLAFGTAGNAILVESNGKYGLIDAGGAVSSGVNGCYNNIISYLLKLNIRELEFVIISHFHWDHVYCMAGQDESNFDGFLLKNNNINVKSVIVKKYDLGRGIHSSRVENFYSRLINLSGNKINYLMQDGYQVILGDMRLNLYNSMQRFGINNIEDNENANSIVVVLEYNSTNRRSLSYFPGDVQNTNNASNVENVIAQKVASIYNSQFDLYVASHHGYSSNNPNGAIGNSTNRIQFRNAIITNTISEYCRAVENQSSAGNAISRIYLNLKRNTNNSNHNIYFSGDNNIIVDYNNSGIIINGGNVLKCSDSTCDNGANTYMKLCKS